MSTAGVCRTILRGLVHKSHSVNTFRIPSRLIRSFSNGNSTKVGEEKSSSHESSRGSEDNTNNLESLRLKLVRASILHIKTEGKLSLYEGFSEQAIARACEDLDLSSASAKLLENGPLAIINYLNAQWNESLALGMDNLAPGNLSRKEKIKAGITHRLQQIQPYVDRWDEALAWMSHPANLLSAHETMLEFASQVLRLAGDDSARMDWYLKRYQLVGVLTATELYMLTDRSPGFTETYAFLDRALDTVELGDAILGQVSNTIFGLWKAKNSVFEAAKDPVVNPETREMKNDHDARGGN